MLDAEKEAEVEIRVEVEYRLRKRLEAEAYEARVQRCMGLIRADWMPDWPFTDVFDDGGLAWRVAKERIQAEQAGKQERVKNDHPAA